MSIERLVDEAPRATGELWCTTHRQPIGRCSEMNDANEIDEGECVWAHVRETEPKQ